MPVPEPSQSLCKPRGVPAALKTFDTFAVTEAWRIFGKAGGQGRVNESGTQPKCFFCIA